MLPGEWGLTSSATADSQLELFQADGLDKRKRRSRLLHYSRRNGLSRCSVRRLPIPLILVKPLNLCLYFRSHQRASRAQKSGLFDKEVVSIEAFAKNPQTGARERVIITKDDGIRHDTTAEGLGKIRSAFPQWAPGNTTGGNASQITDGAGAVLLMTRSKAEKLGLKVVAKFVTTAVAGKALSYLFWGRRVLILLYFQGLAPRIMGIGPSYAIPMVLENAGISISDVDLFEVGIPFQPLREIIEPTLFLFLDQRGLCVDVCILRKEAGPGYREGQRQWRGHRTRPPIR